MTPADMHRTLADFVAAARLARAAVDVLLLDLAQGYLLGSFLSPLSNDRQDDYGGSLANRLRYPLSVFRAVRGEWPADRPLGVRLLAGDRVARGFAPDDAVEAACSLKAEGCDLVQVALGQTVVDEHPDYSRLYGVPPADRIRNEAGIPVIAVGNLTSLDEVNTVVASGRADLGVLELRLPD
jgi:anthraniloyl-CoA monooxygenase